MDCDYFVLGTKNYLNDYIDSDLLNLYQNSEHRSKFIVTSKTCYNCTCLNEWSSLKTTYVIQFNKKTGHWRIILFKQKCKLCNKISVNYTPYEETLELLNLKLRPLIKGDEVESLFAKMDIRGNMSGDHDVERCLACKNGYCKEIGRAHV